MERNNVSVLFPIKKKVCDMTADRLTQADVKHMMDLIAMGGDALTDDLALSLELMTLIERSGVLEAHKLCKDEIAKHPEVEHTAHGVTIQTVSKPEYRLDLRAIERDDTMRHKYALALEARRAEVQPTMTDLGLRSTRAQDLRFLTKHFSDSYKVVVKKSKA